MNFSNPSEAEIEALMRRVKRIAVIGLSPRPDRPSHSVARFLQSRGYEIVPVNPGATQILGERCYPSVTAAAAALAVLGLKIDMVDCFRKSEDIPPIADEAIAIGAKCLWLQIGVINEEAAGKARAAGLEVVMNRCVKIEHARLFGGLGWAGVNTRVISARRPQHLPY